ncbi:hypothetical protein R3P38DRAFT_3324954 [Favolaschia claudopus]|uniref:CxC2-like cysteine cluster KDZ transposase-associated domain-containing protein n=1 Tax=Favolaschia claudopus TaxID=2862362 RepID=A0AAW0AFM8_9AGAR
MSMRKPKQKRKPATTVTFSLDETASHDPRTVASGSATAQILREKTSVGQVDGQIHRRTSLLKFNILDARPSGIHPDIRASEPIYDVHDDGAYDAREEEEGPRDQRDSDDPLRQWAEDYRTIYLAEVLRFEGRGDHAAYTTCECGSDSAEFRCIDCLSGGRLMCGSCMRETHAQSPFHRVQKWAGGFFKRISLKSLNLRIQLGHWHGKSRRCPLPEKAPGDDFVIIHTNGIHNVCLDYCGCGEGGPLPVQLLRAQLWPATTTNPRTAASFAVLRHFHLLGFESKCATLEFYQSLARASDNLHYRKDNNRYHEFRRMAREWKNVRMLKRAGRGHEVDGVARTQAGECALLCPACPQPGKNLLPGWETVSEEKQFIYAIYLALDANFRLKRKDVSTEEKDPGLGDGWAFVCGVKEYMDHVKEHWNMTQQRSHCVAHDAVDKPDREARGTASSGIGAVDCARHNMKRPSAVGDLQLGERYINMDYMFFRSIAGSPLIRFFVSYDIACQWHLHLFTRMEHYENDTLTIDGAGKFFTFLVPKFHLPAHIEDCNLKFSFNLTRDVGQTDGEAPERGWADANPLARSTKEMGPGFRRDTLDDHFNDWNHKKIIALGYTLRRKLEKAVPEMVRTREALTDMNASVGAEVVEEWTDMAVKWEADVEAPNPFETIRKDEHLAKVRAELAKEAAERETAGREDMGAIRGDMHVTELIAMGLQLEQQQRILAADISSTGLHPTDGQRRAMTERTSKLRRKILAWIEVQTKFWPALANVREREDSERTRQSEGVAGVKVSAITLWLPSALRASVGATDVVIQTSVLEMEYRLRVAQAAESLHEIRRLLLVRTHLYKLKDKHMRGVRANTRSADKIAALNEQIKRAASTYRVAREALVVLGRVLSRSEWEWSLQELKEGDVRGLPQSHFHDPERKKKKRRKRKRTEEQQISWIWVSRGERWQPGDDVAMNEAVRIEWAKTRARSMRWAEEVDLLEEEIRRVRAFLLWRSQWWRGRIDLLEREEGPQREGETAYALRQESIQTTLAAEFSKEWEHLPDLVRMGRAGIPGVDGGESTLVEDEENGRAELEEGESEEEDEPIDSLPTRAVKPTYTDEILDM